MLSNLEFKVEERERNRLAAIPSVAMSDMKSMLVDMGFPENRAYDVHAPSALATTHELQGEGSCKDRQQISSECHGLAA